MSRGATDQGSGHCNGEVAARLRESGQWGSARNQQGSNAGRGLWRCRPGLGCAWLHRVNSGNRGALGRDDSEGAAVVQGTGGSGLLGCEASSGHGGFRQGRLWKECDGNGMKMRGGGHLFIKQFG